MIASRLELHRRRRLLLALALLGLVVPLVGDALWHGGRRVYDLFVPDAFAYLTVARNGLSVGQPSFDQTHPTNGFHPLWQATLLIWVGIAKGFGLGHLGILWSVFALGLVLATGGLWFLLAAALSRRIPRAETLLVVVGITALGGLVLPLHPSFDGRPAYSSTWAVVNGMETSLVVFFYGLTGWLFVRGAGRRPDRWALGFGFACTGLALARLDHAIFPLVFLVAFFVRAWLRRDRDALFGAVVIAAPIVALMGTYILYNVTVFAAPVPISGRIKSSYPHIADAYPVLVAVLRGSVTAYSGRAVRLMSLLIPLAISLVYAVLSLRLRYRRRAYEITFRRRRRFPMFLWLSSIGAVGLGVYNFVFVPLFAQGTWYFPVSGLVATLTVVAFLGRTPGWRRWSTTRWGFGGAAVVAIALCTLAFVTRFTPPGHHADYAQLDLDEAPRVVASYEERLEGESVPYLLSFDDGIVAWALPYPVMSRSLLLDPEAFRAMRHENKCVLEVALERGYDRVTSIDYWRPEQLKAAFRLSKRVGERTACPPEVMKRLRIRVEHRSDDESFMIVHVTEGADGTPGPIRP